MKFQESETVELKKSTSNLKEAIISICAILNKHEKGTLYFGIEDSGKVIGQQIGKSTIRDISKAISDHIDPKIYPDIQTVKINDRDCIKVDFNGNENLFSAFGRFYLRSGDEDKKLSVGELEHLVEKKKHYVYSWGFHASEAPISAASVPVLKSFVRKGKDTGRISYSFDSAKNVLNKLNLIKGSKLLNAGKALFCKNNGLEVRAAVFATDEKVTFLDIQSFKGTLFDLIAQCETYVKEHINWQADIVDFKRVETPEVPMKAVREAIVNSLCHRDFDNPALNELAIYRNRIEIYNPGQFPYDYSPEDFISGEEKSIPRNPLIADVFYFTKDIERWGSGLKRIISECKGAGVKVTFGKIKSGFVVTFYRPIKEKRIRVTRIPGRVPEKVTVKVPEKVTENQRKILELIPKNKYVTVTELAKFVEISERKIKENISKLKNKGLLRRVGPDKGGHWEILKG